MSASESTQELADRLLHQAVPDHVADHEILDDRGGDRLLRLFELCVLSLFIAFHVATLLVYSSPGGGIGAQVQQFFRRYLEMDAYMSVTGNATRWEMFAPDPPRVNPFIRVLVVDRGGQVGDLGHDVFGRRKYPYLFFDRLAKINAWGLSAKQDRMAYAAWVCREWERAHGGEPASAVRLVRFLTEIPTPEVAYATRGYNPVLLDVRTIDEETFECRTLPHGQLSPRLRARYGLPPAPDGTFRDVEVSTWWRRAHGAAAGRPAGARTSRAETTSGTVLE